MKRDLKNWVEKKYMILYRKYTVSQAWFIFLNIVCFSLIAAMAIANYYAIRNDVAGHVKVYFIIISILSALVGFITSITSFFTLRKNSVVYKERYENIKHEYKLYKDKAAPYDKKDSKERLIDEVMRIYYGNEEKQNA